MTESLVKRGVRYRRAHVEERDRLMAFLSAHWRADHMFATSGDWLDWQHLGADGERYHVLIAEPESGGDMFGFLGVMPIRKRAVWTGIWTVTASAPNLTGLGMFSALNAIYQPDYIGSIGVNALARRVLTMLRHRTGVCDTYYLANPGMTQVIGANLAKGACAPDGPVKLSVVSLEQTDRWSIAGGHTVAGQLDLRYGAAAAFAYRFIAVSADGAPEPALVLVVRTIEAQGSRLMRIVDALGNPEEAPAFGQALIDGFLKPEGLEYADLAVGGDDTSDFGRLGFHLRSGDAILPSYFDPFVQSNVDLGFSIYGEGRFIFRGDGDQDRPNRPNTPAPTTRRCPI